jgi:hypothetical protein
MPNNQFSSGATNHELAHENTEGPSLREIAEQKLDQLGSYIRAACRSEEAKVSNKTTIDEQRRRPGELEH